MSSRWLCYEADCLDEIINGMGLRRKPNKKEGGEMSNRTLDRHMERDYLREEYSCCECGYRRGCEHHPGIRCPRTGRCGTCGEDWPCEEHKGDVPERLWRKVGRPSYMRREERR
jgi:hypothetical protein